MGSQPRHLGLRSSRSGHALPLGRHLRARPLQPREQLVLVDAEALVVRRLPAHSHRAAAGGKQHQRARRLWCSKRSRRERRRRQLRRRARRRRRIGRVEDVASAPAAPLALAHRAVGRVERLLAERLAPLERGVALRRGVTRDALLTERAALALAVRAVRCPLLRIAPPLALRFARVALHLRLAGTHGAPFALAQLAVVGAVLGRAEVLALLHVRVPHSNGRVRGARRPSRRGRRLLLGRGGAKPAALALAELAVLRRESRVAECVAALVLRIVEHGRRACLAQSTKRARLALAVRAVLIVIARVAPLLTAGRHRLAVHCLAFAATKAAGGAFAQGAVLRGIDSGAEGLAVAEACIV
mmetsp:Transcript_57431/g.131846  ORF Transcript_57431/g.131846 Transcript_57431/m.131846 type:complete len:357 (+) Transcript_57431:2440-3510(+)